MTGQKVKITKDIVVIYHGECSDGFGGAWSAWKKFGDTADYFGAHHDWSPPEGLVGKELYFIDFVYPRPEMEQLKKDNKKITIIDHHKMAIDKLDLADEKLFDINHSGAVLAWQYFHVDKDIPRILKHIEDRDIWKWSLDGSREILMYFGLFDLDFDIWDEVIEQFSRDESMRENFKKDGGLLLRQWFHLCEDIINKDFLSVEFENHKTYAVNASSVFADDIGNKLIEKFPPMAIVWHQKSNGDITVSLRSDGTVDVSEMASKYGGGGHKRSSAFRIKYGKSVPWKIIK